MEGWGDIRLRDHKELGSGVGGVKSEGRKFPLVSPVS